MIHPDDLPSEVLKKPFRVCWIEAHEPTKLMTYSRKFLSEAEATAYMHRMAKSFTWHDCKLFVIQECGVTAEGAGYAEASRCS
jgi:hypothetical protein